MKRVREFMDQTEALMAKDYLGAHGIQAELTGAKDYSTHVVGGTQGRYVLSVDETDAAPAEELLKKSNVSLADETESSASGTEIALKKAVMYAFIAIVLLPILGNWISLREAIRYARSENSSKKWMWLFLISWLQVPGLLIAWIAIKAIFGIELSGAPP
jgi:hypothetical protein